MNSEWFNGKAKELTGKIKEFITNFKEFAHEFNEQIKNQKSQQTEADTKSNSEVLKGISVDAANGNSSRDAALVEAVKGTSSFKLDESVAADDVDKVAEGLAKLSFVELSARASSSGVVYDQNTVDTYFEQCKQYMDDKKALDEAYARGDNTYTYESDLIDLDSKYDSTIVLVAKDAIQRAETFDAEVKGELSRCKSTGESFDKNAFSGFPEESYVVGYMSHEKFENYLESKGTGLCETSEVDKLVPQSSSPIFNIGESSIVSANMTHSEDQNVVNCANIMFAIQSAESSISGTEFDVSEVNDKTSKFISYYTEYSKIDPNSSDISSQIEALNAKYPSEISEAFDAAFTMMEEVETTGLITQDNYPAAFAAGKISDAEFCEYLKGDNIGLNAKASPDFDTQATVENTTEKSSVWDTMVKTATTAQASVADRINSMTATSKTVSTEGLPTVDSSIVEDEYQVDL